MTKETLITCACGCGKRTFNTTQRIVGSVVLHFFTKECKLKWDKEVSDKIRK